MSDVDDKMARIVTPEMMKNLGESFANGLGEEALMDSGPGRVAEYGTRADGTNAVTGKPPRPVLFYESMTKVKCKHTGAEIRIWRNTGTELPEYMDAELLAVFGAIPGGAGIKEMFEIFSSIPGVSAVECTDKNGMGAVAYFEW